MLFFLCIDDWNEPMILSFHILCCLTLFFIYVHFMWFCCCGILYGQFFILGYFSLLANLFSMSMAAGIIVCRGKWHVPYYCLIPSLWGLWCMHPDLIFNSWHLLFCLLCMTLCQGASYLLTWCCLPSLTLLSSSMPLFSWSGMFSVQLSLWYVFTCMPVVYGLNALLWLIWSLSVNMSSRCPVLSQFTHWGNVLSLLASSRCALCLCVIIEKELLSFYLSLLCHLSFLIHSL